ncbi:MAG: MauE/DoxX family redox-associated membrane protein, partial [Acidimicrobiales bacterium]
MNGTGLEVVAVVAALLLAAIFVVAAVAKLRDRPTTVVDFGSLGLPKPELWATAVPLIELATAAVLVVRPGWGGVAAFGLLAAFTANLAMIVKSGRVATCACFGGSSTRPVSSRHLIRNGLLLVLALVAATA